MHPASELKATRITAATNQANVCHRLSPYPLTASIRVSLRHPLILLRSPLIHHLISWYWHREAMFEVNPSIPSAVRLCSLFLFIPGSLCGDGGLSVWSVAEPGDLRGLWQLVDTMFPQRGAVLAVFWSSCAPVFSVSLSCPQCLGRKFDMTHGNWRKFCFCLVVSFWRTMQSSFFSLRFFFHDCKINGEAFLSWLACDGITVRVCVCVCVWKDLHDWWEKDM